MVKYFFSFFVLIHGLIHFMGFAKAFGYGNITQLTKVISKPAGSVWLITATLFIGTAVFFLLKKEWWPVAGLLAAVISQILIISVWKEAKFGTFANILVLAVAIPGFAHARFNKMVSREIAALIKAMPAESKTVITKEMLTGMPPVVQKWLTNAGIIGKEKTQFVRLKQKGELRTTATGKWMSFTASQYFTVYEPQFLWQTEAAMMPFVPINGRDKFVKGRGEMKIKALSLFNVAVESSNDKINSAALIRYLAETAWFPAAAVNNYIKWEAIDSTSAKAIITYKGIKVTGIFKFADNGDILSFEAERYKGSGIEATPEKWLVEMTGYKDFQGIRLPYQNKVTWQLKTGDFTWARIELTDVEYNQPARTATSSYFVLCYIYHPKTI